MSDYRTWVSQTVDLIRVHLTNYELFVQNKGHLKAQIVMFGNTERSATLQQQLKDLNKKIDDVLKDIVTGAKLLQQLEIENKRKSKAHVDTANKVNPFDLHVNPCRHGVLDKRCSYAKCGQPLKSPSRCVEKRKRTLLKELNSLLIRNTLIDNCLDENDATLAR
ncbi:unnamed protein product [Rotaria magnacalcarata]|uniref:Uncharacterized protein n=1 Tax=Rotaria magnacalcarata TaxID=392030 RepID=A0A8S2S1I4_9BILA|nr:unnamed protein product [Rotaria magnacalcarata]CAF4202688.1 unnamed protein product [Rotaria magnacalcarata]CAF5179929.1 unnamed protein product [Rotaria magnacalcarata]